MARSSAVLWAGRLELPGTDALEICRSVSRQATQRLALLVDFALEPPQVLANRILEGVMASLSHATPSPSPLRS
jgi:hypothetical protein